MWFFETVCALPSRSTVTRPWPAHSLRASACVRACVGFHPWDGLAGLAPTEQRIVVTFSFVLGQNCLRISSLGLAVCVETVSGDWELGPRQTHKMTQIGTSHLGPY